MDLNQRRVIATTAQRWVQSPKPGVWRKPLAREDTERGHATSVVRFDPGAQFSRHGHPGGEEILVLTGVFSDETGDYGAGTYLRNPEGSSHAPFSRTGCELLVKLHQFQPDDSKQVVVDTGSARFQPGNDPLTVLPLHQHGGEQVALVRWPAGAKFKPHTHYGGEEIFVIHGTLIDEHGRYPQGTWIRSPHMSRHTPFVEQDTLIWVKVGHLG